MSTRLRSCLLHAVRLLCASALVSCTATYTKSIPGGRFELRKDKGIPANPALGLSGMPGSGEDELYFVPADGQLAMGKNLRQFLDQHKATKMICTFAGTHTTGKRTADGRIDQNQLRTASVRQAIQHGPLKMNPGDFSVVDGSAYINGVKSTEIAMTMPHLGWAGIKVFADDGNAAHIGGIESAAEAVPIARWSAREGDAAMTMTPDAVEVVHPITRQLCKATRLRFTWKNGPGNPVTEEILLRDDVPGRVISASQEIRWRQNNQILTSTYLGLSKVEYR